MHKNNANTIKSNIVFGGYEDFLSGYTRRGRITRRESVNKNKNKYHFNKNDYSYKRDW